MSEERDYDTEAREQGWVPAEEWKGDENKWTGAQEFVEKGEKIAGIATKKSKELEAQLATMQTRMDDIESTKHEFAELHKRALEKERAEKADLIAQLEQKQVDAINEGDGAEFLKTKQEIERIQTEPEQRPGQQPWAKQWASENQWYATDPVLRGVANSLAEELRKSGFNDTGKNFMDEVSKQVKEALPDKFENPNRKQGITSGEGKETDDTAPAKAQSFDALPQDAKEACNRFVAEGILTQKEYVNTYAWD